MCFSATASFGASTFLAAIGAVTIVKAKTPAQRLFAVIPLIFSVQQLSEGILWLSFKNPALAEWQPFFTYTFLVFAMMVWPVWVPFTIRLLEKNAQRKKILTVLTGIGVVVFVSVGCILLLYPVQVVHADHHIHYWFNFPPAAQKLLWVFTACYVLATIIAPFVSGMKKMKWLGIIFLATYLFALIFYNDFVVSVWCYLAAVLSVVVLWIVVGLRKLS
jgi:hypothetical protein